MEPPDTTMLEDKYFTKITKRYYIFIILEIQQLLQQDAPVAKSRKDWMTEINTVNAHVSKTKDNKPYICCVLFDYLPRKLSAILHVDTINLSKKSVNHCMFLSCTYAF